VGFSGAYGRIIRASIQEINEALFNERQEAKLARLYRRIKYYEDSLLCEYV